LIVAIFKNKIKTLSYDSGFLFIKFYNPLTLSMMMLFSPSRISKSGNHNADRPCGHRRRDILVFEPVLI
jgi:hypothetical protein